MAGTRIIGITMGDPAGIGPEIILKALEQMAPRIAAGEFRPVVIGTRQCLADAAARLNLDAELVADGSRAAWPAVPLAEAAVAEAPVATGKVGAEAGRLAYHAVERAVRMALAGEIDAIVTAPISKEAINLAGFRYAGHTDMLADLTKSRDSCMMLAHGRLRVSHVTTHVQLAKVPALVTPERVGRVIELTDEALRALGLERRRIALCALNPHAGEGGMFGTEDQDTLTPTIAAYRERGFDVLGPVPGDTIFVKAVAGQYDAVIAMYHDQGHIPVKLLGFSIDPETGAWTGLSGVNVTLGLPIIRTSVDHGTAFDIAGQGIANAQSMVEAIEFAARMAEARTRRP